MDMVEEEESLKFGVECGANGNASKLLSVNVFASLTDVVGG